MTGPIPSMSYSALHGTNTCNYNDRYFLEAFSAPNPNYTQAQQVQTTTAPIDSKNQATPAQINSNYQNASVNFQGSNKKSNNVAKSIIAIGATAAMIFAGYKCFKTGNGEGLAKILNGAKQYWNKGIDLVSKWKFNLTKQITAGNQVTLRGMTFSINGGELVCFNSSGGKLDLQTIPTKVLERARQILYCK